MTNLPMGTWAQTQPTLTAPYQVQQNPQPIICPQLPAQPNHKDNNRLVQLIQIIENPDSETEKKECNELRLRSGLVISPKEDTSLPQIESEIPTVPKQSTMMEIEIEQGRDIVDQKYLEFFLFPLLHSPRD